MTISPDGREGRDTGDARDTGPGPDAADGGDSADVVLPAGFVVPDDASSLDFDRRLLERERVMARRRARLERVFLTRRWHRYGISGPIVTLCLLVVFIFAALLAMVVPGSGNARPAQLPLASSSVAAGRIGSLLPVETLEGVGRVRHDLGSSSLRPGVVLLIPATCHSSAAVAASCADAIRSVTTTARDFNLATWLIAGNAVANLVELAEAPATADTYAIPLLDRTGAVLKPFRLGQLPTAVFIMGDGTISAIFPNVTKDTAVDPAFDRVLGLA